VRAGLDISLLIRLLGKTDALDNWIAGAGADRIRFGKLRWDNRLEEGATGLKCELCVATVEISKCQTECRPSFFETI
jgi:hypothetical protein